jgi:hypothetical protein
LCFSYENLLSFTDNKFLAQLVQLHTAAAADIATAAQLVQQHTATAALLQLLLHKDVDLVFIHCAPHQQSLLAVKALGISKSIIRGTPSGPGAEDGEGG